MRLHELTHILNHCVHAKGKDARWAGGILIVLGLFLTPWCIGIPILIFGIVKLVEGFNS